MPQSVGLRLAAVRMTRPHCLDTAARLASRLHGKHLVAIPNMN
jgi:hypothetical protein